jgi:peptide/nickel transport system substrate-binding protein
MKKLLSTVFISLLLVSIFLTGCSPSSKTGQPDNQGEDNNEQLDKNEKAADESKASVTQVDVSSITEFHQSPILDDKGLPDITERLPKVPKLTNEIPPELLDYEIGQYGGRLNTVTSVVNWDADVFIMNNEALLNTPGLLGKEFTGNVLKDYEVSDDQKVFTFYMREGLKWSDGEPVTIEDVRFTIEDVLFNEELTPIQPGWLRSGGSASGTPMKFKVVDDYTFKISFDEPYGGFPLALAVQGWRGYTDLLKPAHYLKQFHKNYADAAELEKLIAEADFEEDQERGWISFFNSKDITNWELNHSNAVGFPVLYPWVMKEATKTHTLYERNPYYFKIDAEGNQLPYIDEIQSMFVQDTEVVGLKTIAGEVDFSRETTALVKMPLYKENAEKGGYKALLADMHITPSDIFLNLTHKDPVWREVVRDVRFRQALNYAINRDEVIDSLYYGFAKPSQIIDSTFDLDKANQLLDEMGMEKGSDGYRLGPDGKRFSIPIEVQAAAPDIVPLAELLTQMWKEIGIHVTVKTIDGTLWGTRNAANELKASIIWTTNDALWHFSDWGEGLWAPLWEKWRQTGGKEGEEPPEDVKNLYHLIDQLAVSPPEEALKAVEKVKEEMRKNIYYFIHIEQVKQPLIVNEDLGNVTDKTMAIGVNFSAEQMFFKK